MKLSFRQGIVRHQQDTLGTPTFLDVVGGYVSLIVSSDPTIIAFAHGEKDYLYTERQSVPQAWGQFTPGADRWLYWELDPVTGLRRFGSTNVEPIETAVMPQSPVTGQMWFNATNTTWYEFNGAAWVDVIRVFACRLDAGITPRSMSINAPAFTGTQVGITAGRRVGALAYDSAGKPIRTGDRKFFTTEDIFVTGIPTGASVRVSNIVLPGVAQQPLSAYSVVQYYDFNKLVPASPYSQGTKLYGFIEEDAATGEMINFVTEGMIVNDQWDWVSGGASVNDPVYNDNTGIISLTPAIPNQLPVGVVTGRNEILFTPRMFPQVEANVTVSQEFIELNDTPPSYAGQAGQYLRVSSTETALEFVTIDTVAQWGSIFGTIDDQNDLIVALNARAPIGHTHTETDIIDLDRYTISAVDGLLALKSDIDHVHTITNVTGLQTELDSKANNNHAHAVSDVIGLQTQLNAKAASNHVHTTTNVTGLQTELDSKAETGANVGAGSGLFRDKTGATLNFKTLVAGSNVTLSAAADTITINAAGGTGGTGGTSIPDGTSQCQVPVWNAGTSEWVPRAQPTYMEPYDISLSMPGDIPDDQLVLRFVATRFTAIPDYGHQGHGRLSGNIPAVWEIYPPSPTPRDLTTTFHVFVNGTQVGMLSFEDYSTGASGQLFFVPNIGAAKLYGAWPSTIAEFYFGHFLILFPGDVLDIRSPAAIPPEVLPTTDLVDIGITLRAFNFPISPVECAAAMTLNFTKDATLGEFYSGGDLPQWTATGTFTHAEWACLGIVETGTFPPAGLEDISPTPFAPLVFDEAGTVIIADDHPIHYSTNISDPIVGILPSLDVYSLVRLTLFGPSGYVTNICWVKVPGAGP